MSLWVRRKMAMQFLYAMNFLHKHDVCHRDLSYGNVLIHTYDDGAFAVKVSDFGLAKERNSDLTSTGSSMKGSIEDPALKSFKDFKPVNDIYLFDWFHSQLHPHWQGEPCHRWIAAGLHHPEMLGHQPRGPVSDGEGHHRGYEKDGMPRRIKTGPGGRK